MKDHHRARRGRWSGPSDDRPTTGQSTGQARRFASMETCPERDKLDGHDHAMIGQTTPTSIHTEVRTRLCQELCKDLGVLCLCERVGGINEVCA